MFSVDMGQDKCDQLRKFRIKALLVHRVDRGITLWACPNGNKTIQMHKTMKNPSFLFGLLLSTLIFTSCTKHRIEGSGNIVTQDRGISGFENVQINSVVETNIVQGTDFSVTVRTDAVALNKVHTYLSGNSLVIDLDEHYNYHHITFHVDIEMPTISKLTHNGVSDSRLSGFIGLTDLEVDHNGVGDLQLSGTAGRLELLHDGVGDLSAFAFASDTCRALLSGVGNMEISVADLLEGHLSGVGNIYYQGDPTVNVSDSGVGSIIQIN